MDISSYAGKTVLVVFDDGSSFSRRVGRVTWIDVNFLEIIDSGRKHLIPLNKIIRAEVLSQ